MATSGTDQILQARARLQAARSAFMHLAASADEAETTGLLHAALREVDRARDALRAAETERRGGQCSLRAPCWNPHLHCRASANPFFFPAIAGSPARAREALA